MKRKKSLDKTREHDNQKTEIERMKEDIRKRMAERKKKELDKKIQEIRKKEVALDKKEALILSKKAKLTNSTRRQNDLSKPRTSPKTSIREKKNISVQTYTEHLPICINCLKSRKKKDEEQSKKEDKEYEHPKLETFEYDSSGYYFDKTTGFYFDPKSEHFYDPKNKQWMFWYSRYDQYFPCDGGDFITKKGIQDSERETLMGSLALSIKSAIPILPVNEEKVGNISN